MNNQKIEKIFVSIIKICLVLLVFSPLILSANYFFPAIFPKAVFARLLIELMIIAYIPLAVMSPKFRPKYHLIYASLMLFGVIVLVSAIAGENFSFSFWGNYERMDGIFSWLHYCAAIVICASVLKEKKEWMILFGFSVFAAVIMSGYGFLQRIGAEHLGPLIIHETNLGRITGTIANPAFLAVYLFFNLLFGLLIVADASIKKQYRIISCMALILIFTAFIMTGVRGAFIGFIASVVLFFFGILFWIQNARAKRLAGQGFLAFVAVLALLYGMVGKNQWVTSNFGRFFKISISDSTTQTRIISWRGALEGFKDNPWLGVGPQKFDIVFNQYFDPRFYSLVGNETWWDRAHNMILEVAATIGTIGLLAYLAVGIALIHSIWCMAWKEYARKTEAVILMAFLAGYFVQNLFVFDTISSYIMLIVLIGYIISRTYQDKATPTRIKKVFVGAFAQLREFFPRVKESQWWIAGAVGAIIMAPVAYAGNIQLIKHNQLFLKTMAFSHAQPFSETIENYSRIFSISNFDSREVGIKLCQYIRKMSISGKLIAEELQFGYGFVIEVMDQIIAQNPKDVRLILSYADALNVYAELIKQKDKNESDRVLKKSEQLLLQAVEYGPARQQVFYSLANVYLISDNYDQGIKTLQDAVALNPDNPQPYWLLALANIQNGDYEPGIQALDRAIERKYRFSGESEALPIANLLSQINDYERTLGLYQQIFKTVHTSSVQAKIAATLAKLGRAEEAISAALQVLEINPDLKDQVDGFIEKVQKGEQADF